MRRTIQQVVDSRLCTSCGACSGVCHAGAVSMRRDDYGIYAPVINLSDCNGCGLCAKVCPGGDFDYAGTHERISGCLPDDVALGPCIETFAAYAKDAGVLQKSQSGGFVSSLLIYALEQRLIDGAVVTRWNPEAPLEPETFVAQDRTQVLSAVGSIYHPVPAAAAIKQLRGRSGRYAFVGTSCQIQAMRKAEEHLPWLRDRVVLYLGLHCLGVLTWHFQDQILHKTHVSRSDVRSYRQRADDPEGGRNGLIIVDRANRVHRVGRYASRIFPRPVFANWRCQLCFDKSNEYADVSCGDCRNPSARAQAASDGHDLRKGLSEVVVRSARARDLVDRLRQSGVLICYPCSAEDVTRSIGVAGKKLEATLFAGVAGVFGLERPDYGIAFRPAAGSMKWSRTKPLRWVVGLQSAGNHLLMRHRLYRSILKRTPHVLFALQACLAYALTVAASKFIPLRRVDAPPAREASEKAS